MTAILVEIPKLLHNGRTETFTAAADLSNSLYRAVSIVTGQSSGGRASVNLPTSNGVKIIGILVNRPTLGQLAEVVIQGGEAPWEAATTLNAGVELMADTNGRAILATAGNYVGAVSKQASQGLGHQIATIVNSYKI